MTINDTTTTKKLKPVEVGAGAGAAVITAFASSYLGTAGTLTGAAVASVLGTVSTSLLRSSAETSAARLRQTSARIKQTRTQAGRAAARPVGDDVDPYGTQVISSRLWIDPEATRGIGAGPTGTAAGDLDALTSRLPDRTGFPDPAHATDPAGGTSWNRTTDPIGTGATRLGEAGTRHLPDQNGTRFDPADLVGSRNDPGDHNGRTGADRPGGPTGVGGPGRQAELSGLGGPGSTAAAGPGAPRGRSRWVVLGTGAVAAFALALGAITGIESAAGKPLAGLVGKESGGGTTLGRATGTYSTGGSDRPAPTPSSGTPSPTDIRPASPSSGPTGGESPAPSSEPTQSQPGSGAPGSGSPSQPAPTQAPSGSSAPLTSATP